MKYCIFVLAHYNHDLLEKSLVHLIKYTTPKVDKYILLNNPTDQVLGVAEKFKKDFFAYLYQGPNFAGKAIDDFLYNNNYDFYFKLDEDIIVATPDWDKRLLLTYLNYGEEPGFISCMIPNHNYNWIECIKQLHLEQEFKANFPYDLENYSESGLFKKKAVIIKDLMKANIQNFADNNSIEGLEKEEMVKSLETMTEKVDKSRFYTSPIIYDSKIAEWLWKKVLELKLKPVNKVKKVNREYTINLIGFKRNFWEQMKTFGIDDEAEINEYCFSNNLPIIADYSVIAHHYSYRMQYEQIKKRVYPLIKDKLF